jgi:hypothetical protein
VFFQGRTASGGWRTYERVVLDLTGRARFERALPRSVTQVRAYISPAQVGEGYLAGVSKTRRAEHPRS